MSAVPSPRDWRQIADEASREHDPEKLLELARELQRALDERDKKPSGSEARPKPLKSHSVS